ncbi:GNAT family N-acetyltransferase [Plantibacter sp. CFBP 13570]|uniref:GNAT family N-acetyltransferase n=1 Tax=Plantibacter sp. CFBP 13570 TaxID=2775272 RepID=UPI001FD54AC5|nr:GNAT family N-acetyltransferase [Plantibacter sp. CFBP 13570]
MNSVIRPPSAVLCRRRATMRPILPHYSSQMPSIARDTDYDKFEPEFSYGRDAAFTAWQNQLAHLPPSAVSIREATPTGQDGRRVKDLQFICEPIAVKSVGENVSMIADRFVLLAEIDEVHVGLCVAVRGVRRSDPLFIQVVGVAPPAQRRGIGLALLTAAADLEPLRDIALATQNENVAALAMIDGFARSIGTVAERVRLGTYRDRDLGISRGHGYRAWTIRRPSAG